MSKCHKCGLQFSKEDLENAAKGMTGDECRVGDWDWVCYPCQLKMIESGDYEEWREKQLTNHGGGRCDH